MTEQEKNFLAAERAADFSFSCERDDVIAEAFARMSLGELRKMPLTNLPRAGAYMAARLRAPYYLCALFLNKRGRFVDDKLIRIGPRWDFKGIINLLNRFSDETEAPFMILAASRHIPWEDVIPFDSVYVALLKRGVKIIDLMEVTENGFASLLKPITKEITNDYEEFKRK